MPNYQQYRYSARLTQAQVAEKLDVNQTTVSMWELGNSNPRAELLPKIAAL